MIPDSRFSREIRAVNDSVLEGPGETDPALRAAAAARAADLGMGREPATEVPDDLAPYLDKVAKWAYKVVDEDIEDLKAAGYSEDEIFELTVAVSVGSALARLEGGMRALRGDES